MAACGSIQHIFDKPLDNPTLLFDSLSSWKHISPIKPLVDDSSASSFTTDMYIGELHFVGDKSNSVLSSPRAVSIPSSPVTTEISPVEAPIDKALKKDEHKVSFSSMNSDSLSMCTEGLGFESFDDVEDGKSQGSVSDEKQRRQERRRSFSTTTRHAISEILSGEPKRSRITGVEFPPPISTLGRKVCFKSYRNNGRFILKEVRIPTQEFLHASREDGRLKLQFIQSDDEAIDEEDEVVEERKYGEKVSNEAIDHDCHKDDDDDTEKNEI